MTIRTVILDFDGTCTDVEQEAQGFLEAYRRDLRAHLGLPTLSGTWEAAARDVQAAPHLHGMRMGGRLVAPAVDPYLLATAIAAVIAPDLDDATSERLFRDGYRFTTCHFKPGARQVIEALVQAAVSFYIVTNSDPETVGRKLDLLAPAGRRDIRLVGNARKFLVAEPPRHPGHARYTAVPETVQVSGWGRPVFTRRGHYFDVLQAIWDETATMPEETLVIGDVFELDLALPATLGCRIHLAESPRTLPYEREAVRSFGGRHDPDLRAALDDLGSTS